MSQGFTIRATGSNVLSGLQDNFSNLRGIRLDFVPFPEQSGEAGSIDLQVSGGPFALGFDWASAFVDALDSTNLDTVVIVSGGSDGTDYEDIIRVEIDNFETLDFTMTPILDPTAGVSGGGFAISEYDPDTALIFGSPGADRIDDLDSSRRTPGRDVDSGVATRRATDNGDNLVGIDAPDIFDGFGGNDTISGAGGNDTLDGGPGNDLIRGGPGNDSYFGWEGQDRISDSEGRNIVNLGNYSGFERTATGDLSFDFPNGAQLTIEDYFSSGRESRFQFLSFGSPVAISFVPSPPSLSNDQIREGPSVGVVGTLSSGGGSGISYRIVDDQTGLFAISGDRLILDAAVDFERTSSFVVAESASGSSDPRRLTIEVEDVNEPPSPVRLSSTAVIERVPVGFEVSQVESVDPEGRPVTFQLIDDAGGLFRLDGAALVLAAPLDVASSPAPQIEILASDGVLSTAQRLTIDVLPSAGAFVVGTETDDFILLRSSIDPNAPGRAGNGDDTIDGLDGIDTVTYELDRIDVQEAVLPSGDISVVIGGAETDLLTNVEIIQLNDGSYLYGLRDEIDFTYRTYAAALGRTPDGAGLVFWDNQRASGLSERDLAGAFVASPEFDELFGGPLAPVETFVSALYRNVLGRDGDEEGTRFWIDAIENGVLDRVEMLLAFVDAPENISQNADNYDDGVWVL